MSPNKKIAAVVLTTVVMSIGVGGVASASQPKSNTKSVSVRQTTTRAPVNSMAGMGKMNIQGSDLATVLSTLVKAGTIAQTQSDAITAAMNAARAAHEATQGVNHGAMDPNPGARQTLIATTIGKTPAEIQTALAAGQTLGAIAGDKRAALITALVAEETKQIDAAVTAGKMTAAQATTLKAGLTAHVTAEVDSVRPAMGPGMGMGGKMGGHGFNH